MIVLGLILLVLCVLLGAGIMLSNTDPVSAEAFGVSLENVSVGGMFLAGVGVGAVAMVGLGLMLAGAGRSRSKKKALKRDRHDRESLAQENARLHTELDASGPAAYPSEGERSRSGAAGERSR